jgi:hypothetical protein
MTRSNPSLRKIDEIRFELVGDGVPYSSMAVPGALRAQSRSFVSPA